MRDYAKKQNWNAPLAQKPQSEVGRVRPRVRENPVNRESSGARENPVNRESSGARDHSWGRENPPEPRLNSRSSAQRSDARIRDLHVDQGVQEDSFERVDASRYRAASPAAPSAEQAPSPHGTRSQPVSPPKFIRWVVLGILVITIGALLWHASSPWRAAHAEKERIAKAMAARAAMEASPSQLGNTLPPPPPSATPVVSAPPQFDFYKILPAKTTADRPVLNITGPVSQTGYLIQVGVFSTQDAANVIKAKLLMLGYSPSVAMVPGGAYSVTLGPIVTQNGASMIVRKLRSEGFQDINVKYLN